MSFESDLRGGLEVLYARWNTPSAIGPDPVGFVHDYSDPIEQEVAALISATLAFGRVVQIRNSLSRLFSVLSGRSLLEGLPGLRDRLGDFRHRFVTAENIAALLEAALAVVGRHGSLGECFRGHLRDDEPTTQKALERFVDELCSLGGRSAGFLFSQPRLGGAAKRWHLFLRWMVRADRVDVGLWREVGAERLVVPLDTHMYRIGRALGFTSRKTPDGKTALEVTAGFRRVCPEDPVRYDFALARSAMEGSGEVEGLLRGTGAQK